MDELSCTESVCAMRRVVSNGEASRESHLKGWMMEEALKAGLPPIYGNSIESGPLGACKGNSKNELV